jgi:hypothetical protein
MLLLPTASGSLVPAAALRRSCCAYSSANFCLLTVASARSSLRPASSSSVSLMICIMIHEQAEIMKDRAGFVRQQD